MLKYPHHRFYLKLPGRGRTSFALIRDTLRAPGARSVVQWGDTRIDTLNAAYKANVRGLYETELLCREVVASLRAEEAKRQPGPGDYAEDNLKILKDYWDYRYANAGLERPEIADDELRLALDCLGPLSLYTGSREEIQKSIDAKATGNRQRRVVQRVTAFLKFIGRTDIRLRKHPKVRARVKHIGEADLSRLLKAVEDPALRALIGVAFYLGVRPGEAYALIEDSLLPAGDLVRVTEQLHFSNKYLKATKNKVERLAYLIEGGLPHLRVWLGLDEREKARMVTMRRRLAKILRPYCVKLWPKEPLKHLAFKDLRHCYAIRLARSGISLNLISQSMGNTEAVCQEYYSGFVLAADSVTAIRALMSKSG